jgi:hypothetical protein
MLSEELHVVPAGEAVHAFYTYDQQSEDGTNLGMGLMIGADIFKGISEAPESGDGIVDTYCIHMDAVTERPVNFRFYTVWEREDDRWKSAERFEELLVTEASIMEDPVIWSLEEK